MTQPIFSLAYTSVRPEYIMNVVDLWRRTATGKFPIEVVIAVDAGFPGASNPPTHGQARAVKDAKVVIQTEPPFNCVKGWNLAAAHTTGKIIIAVADDFRPCSDWDEKLFTLKPNWYDEDWIAHTEDGYVHDIAVLAILTRKRYERFGYLFYPGYESMFCDTEFTDCAYSEGRAINAKHILIEHLHPDARKRSRDEHDAEHASRERWTRGEMLFNYRKHRRYPIDAGPRVQPAPEPKTEVAPVADPYAGYAVYMQVNRDDLCLNEVCRRFYDEGLRNFFFAIPDEYWSGKPTEKQHLEEVLECAEALTRLGAKAKTRVFRVSDYRFSGDSRITVETRVRNDSLAWVRQHGFHHICVADSDELWPKGSLAKIKEIVDASSPAAISLPMTPVMGYPGYPIHDAQDRVLSYVGGSCIFKDCRTPVGVIPYYENSFRVIHFTSTRKTMEATVEKHRQSGHFDDPMYDFEGWLKNTLPNAKPGMKNAHMFKGYQIWPEIREWTEAELADIPVSIHQYLALPKNG